ncbi:MAG: hypothetical protein OQK82_00960 [Candidatus Pacearchaeota archaeon]|nr:hypothetical protein [Candidatus Pacearchaeota archaeon]
MGKINTMKNKINLILIGILLLGFINLTYVSALSVTIHVPEKYTNVVAGERFYFEIEIKYPENPKRKDLRLEYEILTKDGEIIAQSKVLKAVETQASFIDFIVIPENAKEGLHIVNIKVKDYEDLSEDVSASFYVKSSNEIRLYFFILLGVITLVGILVLINIFWKNKK